MAGMIAIAPSAVMAADMENGAQVFAGNCAACHAGGNNVIQNEKVNNSFNAISIPPYVSSREETTRELHLMKFKLRFVRLMAVMKSRIATPSSKFGASTDGK